MNRPRSAFDGRGWRSGAVAACLRWALVLLHLGGAAAMAAGEPGWFDGGRPGAMARQAVEMLAAAHGHGLEPRDYGAEALRQAVAAGLQGAPPEAAAAAALEQALTTAMRRYLADLHFGRVDPRRMPQEFALPRREPFDPAAALRAALAAHDLRRAEGEATPRVPMYERLRESLAHYRAMADHAAWRAPLPPLPRAPRARLAKLDPGQPWPGLPTLAARLQALGDLESVPAAVAPPPAPASVAAAPVYEGVLVDAVKAFQRRHGLTDDGVVGAATLKQLQVTPAARARQIELALERLRWTPLLQGPRMVVVNIPEFVLRAYEVDGGRIRVRHEMKVIVGKAMDTRTPLFDEDMRFIEFSPYWNVPPSIARGEVVPRLRRDPGYLAREGFEFVGADGGVATALTPAALDAVLAGRQRIRQRPGPNNALGDIKFVFPNRNHIYLHHTPSTQLFGRDRRDFSHGCIRVEHPVALAGFVLQGQAGWDEARIRQAMERGTSSTLKLDEPVRVLIAYGTTIVKDGRTYFYEDIYGHDRLLDAALKRPAPTSRSAATETHRSTP